MSLSEINEVMAHDNEDYFALCLKDDTTNQSAAKSSQFAAPSSDANFGTRKIENTQKRYEKQTNGL